MVKISFEHFLGGGRGSWYTSPLKRLCKMCSFVRLFWMSLNNVLLEQWSFYQSFKMLFMCQFILLITYIKFLASSNHLRHLAAQNQNVYNLKPNLTRWTKYMLNTRVTILITLRHLSYSPRLYRVLIKWRNDLTRSKWVTFSGKYKLAWLSGGTLQAIWIAYNYLFKI